MVPGPPLATHGTLPGRTCSRTRDLDLVAGPRLLETAVEKMRRSHLRYGKMLVESPLQRPIPDGLDCIDPNLRDANVRATAPCLRSPAASANERFTSRSHAEQEPSYVVSPALLVLRSRRFVQPSRSDCTGTSTNSLAVQASAHRTSCMCYTRRAEHHSDFSRVFKEPRVRCGDDFKDI